MSYVTKVYKEPGGDKMVIDNGGEIEVVAGGKITNAGTQASAIVNAKADYATGDLDIEAEIITAVNASNGKINAIIAALKGVGIIAS